MNLKEFVLGVKAKGEKMPPPNFKTYHYDRMDFFDWCRLYNVGIRDNSISMYHVNQIDYVND